MVQWFWFITGLCASPEEAAAVASSFPSGVKLIFPKVFVKKITLLHVMVGCLLMEVRGGLWWFSVSILSRLWFVKSYEIWGLYILLFSWSIYFPSVEIWKCMLVVVHVSAWFLIFEKNHNVVVFIISFGKWFKGCIFIFLKIIMFDSIMSYYEIEQ